MKLKTQILLGYMLFLSFSVVLAVFFSYYVDKIGVASERVLKENYRSLKASENMLASLSVLDQSLAKICLNDSYPKENSNNQVNQQIEYFYSQIIISKDALEAQGDSAIIPLINNIESSFDLYYRYIKSLSQIQDLKSYYFTPMQTQNSVIRDLVRRLIDYNHQMLGIRDNAVRAINFQAKLYGFLILISILLVAGYAAYIIPERLVRPVLDLTGKIREISEGKYDQKLKVGSNSEFSNLARAFNRMTARILEFEASNLAQIKTQKSQMEYIIKSIRDGLIILDEKKSIVIINDRATEILQVDQKNLIGANAVKLAKKSPALDEVMRSIRKMEEPSKDENTKDSDSISNFLKVSSRFGGNQSFFLKEIVRVVDDSDWVNAHFLGYIILLKDITNFKKSDEAKTQFIAKVSHELKTPLSALNMSLMLLNDDRLGSLNEEQKGLASSMKREVQRLMSMVKELLDLSQMETGNIRLVLRETAPEDIINDAIAPLRAQLEDKDIRLSNLIDPDIRLVLVDPEKISWVLINFLTNAIRYSPRRGQITINVRSLKNEVEFSVQDQGQGLSSKDFDRVFNKFVQINPQEKNHKTGLGLGLAISKEIVEEHSGRVGVESELGRGAKFYFRIPKLPEDTYFKKQKTGSEVSEKESL